MDYQNKPEDWSVRDPRAMRRLNTATEGICDAAELYGMKAAKRPEAKSAWSPKPLKMRSRSIRKHKRPDAGIPSSRPRIGANPPRPRRPFIGQVIAA